MNKLKYTHYDVVFQEVPNEISLVFNISGCPHQCEGCHSKYLWEYVGSYIRDDIKAILNKYKTMITCVCFMGGDQNTRELFEFIKIAKFDYGLKTCVYSGCDSIGEFNDSLCHLDYIKIGKYKSELGGLNNITTNQRFYKIVNNKLEDLTHTFQEKDANSLSN